LRTAYRKQFLKELARVPPKTRVKIEALAFEELPKMNSIWETRKVERMKGYRSYYKIRFGSYRVGLKIEGDTVIFERVLHRKDIYRYFP
jgi:mRNA interferase RelE/StbE